MIISNIGSRLKVLSHYTNMKIVIVAMICYLDKLCQFCCSFSCVSDSSSWFFTSQHCKNCGVLCPPNEQHTIGVISHRPLKVCLAHLIWCARS